MRLSDRILIWLAWHLPKPLVKWCAIRLMANATQGKWGEQSPTTLFAMDALERWEDA